MQLPPKNIEEILPHGEGLRTFLEQSFITKSDLKVALRKRGVFVGNAEKSHTIPIFFSSLISPSEFDSLRERQITREDNPKTLAKTLKWNSSKPLLECIPGALNLNELIKNQHVNYKIIGSPQFVPIGNGGDHVRLEFQIERKDLSKSWAVTESKFKGSIELKRIVQGDTVKLVITHTAAETKDLSRSLTNYITRHFRNNSYMPQVGGMVEILFNDFTNEQRVQFFKSLTSDIEEDGFEFDDIVDYNVCPEKDKEFPTELKWMEKNVSELNLKGRALHESLFMKNEAYHPMLLFFKMEAKYKFEYHGGKGNCSVVFEFADFDRDDPAKCEFQTNISQLSLAPEFAGSNKIHVKERLLRDVEAFVYKRSQRIVQTAPPLSGQPHSDAPKE